LGVFNRAGYTFVEALMTMVVIAILSAVVIININNAMRGIQISTAADRLVSDLRFAQTMASGAGIWYGVSFEVAPDNRYYVYTTTGTVDTLAENPGKRGSTFVINLGTDFGVTISAATIEGGKKIEFSPYQVPYNDKSGTTITSEAVITLQREGSSRTVRITPTAGRIYSQ
jgi:Tfp pilus assembly protein FimT